MWVHPRDFSLVHWRRDPKQGIWVGVFCRELRIDGGVLSGLYGLWDAYQLPGETKTKAEAFQELGKKNPGL